MPTWMTMDEFDNIDLSGLTNMRPMAVFPDRSGYGGKLMENVIQARANGDTLVYSYSYNGGPKEIKIALDNAGTIGSQSRMSAVKGGLPYDEFTDRIGSDPTREEMIDRIQSNGWRDERAKEDKLAAERGRPTQSLDEVLWQSLRAAAVSGYGIPVEFGVDQRTDRLTMRATNLTQRERVELMVAIDRLNIARKQVSPAYPPNDDETPGETYLGSLGGAQDFLDLVPDKYPKPNPQGKRQLIFEDEE